MLSDFKFTTPHHCYSKHNNYVIQKRKLKRYGYVGLGKITEATETQNLESGAQAANLLAFQAGAGRGG